MGGRESASSHGDPNNEVAYEQASKGWGLNVLELSEQMRFQLAVFTISHFHETPVGGVHFRLMEDMETLRRFVAATEKEYLPNPYHNFSHAVDVVHCVACHMRLINSAEFLSALNQFALLIAAIGHDIGHPGYNNGFLLETGHELAIKYNDRSPLENMHCARLYSIVANPQTNVFAKLTPTQYKEVRQICIETILHTDMLGHQAMVKDLHMTYQINSEVFEMRSVRLKESLTTARLSVPADGRPDSSSVQLQGARDDISSREVFREHETKTLAMNAILHSADVSNPCRTWEVTQPLAWACLEEFFEQGDREKELGVPVQFLNDRDKLNKPNSQIGFIEFVIAPFFMAQIHLWPQLGELGYNLANNMGRWKDYWEEESSPSEEEIQKVNARVAKVQESFEAQQVRMTY